MKSFIFRTVIALWAFSIGVIAASIWFALHRPPLYKVEEQPISLQSNVEIAQLSSEEYFQVGADERSMGIFHKLRHRSEYSSIFGILSEFVNLKGKSKKNTFYISKIESVDDQCNENSNYVCSYVHVYWKEDKSVLTLYPPFDKEDGTFYEWIYSMRRVDLLKDVVPTWKEVGTSNYLVPKSEAQEMIKECRASGIKLSIEKP